MTQPNQELLNFITALRVALPKWLPSAYYTKHPVLWKPIDGADSYDAGFNQAKEEITQIIDQLSKEYGIPENWGDIE